MSDLRCLVRAESLMPLVHDGFRQFPDDFLSPNFVCILHSMPFEKLQQLKGTSPIGLEKKGEASDILGSLLTRFIL